MADWSDDEVDKPKKQAPKASNDDDWGATSKPASSSGGSRGGFTASRGGSRGGFSGGGDRGESNSRKPLSEPVTGPIFVESKMVGRIVGPKGAVIQELQSTYDVKININKEENEDGKKEVEVVGDDDDNVQNCYKAILEKTDGGGDRAARDEGSGGSSRESIAIMPNLVGRIVGSGGSVIQDLQSTYDVKINISKEDNDDGMREVEVIGDDDESVQNCMKAIREKIEGGRRDGGDRPPRDEGSGGNSRDTVAIAANLIGRIVGAAGATIQKLQEDFSVKINIAKEDNSDGKREIEVLGDDDAHVKKCIKAINDKVGDGDDKPREIYVPPEPTNDEDEMFGAGIGAGINFDQFDKIEVKVTGKSSGDMPPLASFYNSGLREFLLKNIERSGYTKPTPIQKHAIPVIMAARDLMGCAQTGSGKTAAFMLPILHNIMSGGNDMKTGQPQCLIVAPTRELVIQIFEEARKFANTSWVKVCLAYGGTASRHQGDTITRGCHVVVATPGRLMDFVNKGTITFESLRYLVLDEADRMLDMGFKETIDQICKHETIHKSKVQTLMFSATFPEIIQHLAGEYLREYIFIAVGVVGGASTDVEQEVIEVGKFKKRAKLMEVLEDYCKNSQEDRILIFVETKRTADFLASILSETKMSSTSIHGDRLQREREEALRDFRTGKRKILVATSVAARGLDIKGVTHVINYDLPKDVQDYVHRIGRTGRVGNRGKATSFYDPETDSAVSGDLARILSEAKQPVPAFLGEGSYSGGGSDSFGGRDIRKGVDAGKKQEEEEDW